MDNNWTQDYLDRFAKESYIDYMTKVGKAPFRQTRVLGVLVEGRWQVERRFIDNVKTCSQIAQTFNLNNPLEGAELPEGKEPGMFDEQG